MDWPVEDSTFSRMKIILKFKRDQNFFLLFFNVFIKITPTLEIDHESRET